ncbi:Uncharacterized protein GBIM_11731 [Gryllus bimaculatus]|nr:Uncharacterized protein GBIM_11731 [Gryllus bimaculatus]
MAAASAIWLAVEERTTIVTILIVHAIMASIEVSLSTTPRRKKSAGLVVGAGGGVGPGGAGVGVGMGVGMGVGVGGGPLHRAHKDVHKELEVHAHSGLKGQLCSSLSINRLSYLRPAAPPQPLTEAERRAAEERLQRLRQEMDNKRLAIKNLKMALERLDITDNIDVRIQQAELEYQLGREELNLLTLLEESRGLQAALDDAAEQSRARSDATSLYSCVSGAAYVSLHAVELTYDPKSPRFGAGPRDGQPGLYVDWAADGAGMAKGDRLVEVNGRLVLSKGRDDLVRLLAASPEPAQLVVLRARAEPPADAQATAALAALRDELESARGRADGLRGANVAELMGRLAQQAPTPQTPSSPTAGEGGTVNGGLAPHAGRPPPHAPPPNAPAPNKTEVQVFQKGPQVTALIANLPGLEVGSRSPAESRHSLPTLRPKPPASASAVTSTNHTPMKNHDARSAKSLDFGPDGSSMNGLHHHHHHHHHHKHDKRYHLHNARSTNSLDVCNSEAIRAKHADQHCNSDMYRVKSGHSMLEYGLDANAAIEHKRAHQRKHIEGHHHRRSESRPLTEAKSLKSILDYTSESSTGMQRIRKSDARSVKSLDFDSEPTLTPQHRHENRHHISRTNDARSTKSLDYSSESSSQAHYRKNGEECKTQRPTPPKKPLRLSLHKATSLQSVNNNTPPPTPPTQIDVRMNGIKRHIKGEAPPAPVVIRISEGQQQMIHNSCHTMQNSCHPNNHWPPQPQTNTIQVVHATPSMKGIMSEEKWY